MKPTLQEPALTLMTLIRQIVLVCLALLLSLGSVSGGRGPANRPLRVLIQTGERIHQPGCGLATSFPLTPAVVSHLKYALAARQISFVMDTVAPDELDSVHQAWAQSWPEERILIVKPVGNVTMIDSLCLGTVTVELRYIQGGGDPGRLDLQEETELVESVRGAADFPLNCNGVPDSSLVYGQNLAPNPVRSALRQSVAALAAHQPLGNGAALLAGRPLPTVVYVDSSFVRSYPAHWQKTIMVTTETASRSLSDQFGVRLEVMPPRVLTSGLDSSRTFEELFYRLRRRLSNQGDTLVVVLYNQPLSDSTRNGDMRRAELGRAQVGRRLILLEGLPDPNDPSLFWLPFDNALNLLHEIGHAFGAVHVSDIFSVMHPVASWTGSARFDDFNRRLVAAALDGRLLFESPLDYVSFFVGTLRASEYNRVDYPAVLAGYLRGSGGGLSRWGRRMRAAIGDASVLHAAEGYLLLSMGRRRQAEASFQRAARQDERQASLFYYLSLATDGDRSDRLRQRAARMGFYDALGCRQVPFPPEDD